VVEDQLISDETEWRSFSNDKSTAAERDRVGRPTNPLLDDVGLSSTLEGGVGELGRSHSRSGLSSKHKSLLEGFGEVDRSGRLVGLTQSVILRAQELFKEIHMQNLARGYPRDCIVAACLFLASKHAHVDRMIKEICLIMKTSRKVVGRVILKLQKNLKISSDARDPRDKFAIPASSTTIMLRFCKLLDLPEHLITLAMDISENVRRIGLCEGQTPSVVAGASIFFACNLYPEFIRSAQQIGEAVGISESSLRSTYRKILTRRIEVIPEEFASTHIVEALS
jgi:transcription initiation factor TFIIB